MQHVNTNLLKRQVINQIIAEEAQREEVDVHLLKSGYKRRPYPTVRWRIAYRFKHEVGISFCRMGVILNIERSTLNRGVLKMEKRLQSKRCTC